MFFRSFAGKLSLFLATGCYLLLPVENSVWGQARQVPDSEGFALAIDRDAVIENMVPGTDSYYWTVSLHHQNQGNIELVEPVLEQWRNSIGETQRWQQIKTRQMLLTFDRNPEATIRYLSDKLNLEFAHQRQLPPAEVSLPSSLDTALIEADGQIDRVINGNRNLSDLTDAALYLLGNRARSLSIQRKRDLLQRVRYPDFPDLVPLIIDELNDRNSAGFGSLAAHAVLTTGQLAQLHERLPALLGNEAFVHTVVRRMHTHQPAMPDLKKSRRNDLDRIIAFLRPLPPSQNSLKAAAIHERLNLALPTEMDSLRPLFIEYLKLPISASYIHPKRRENAGVSGNNVNLSTDYSAILRCLPPQSDQPLVERLLQHYLADEAGVADFSDLLEENFLNRQLAIAQVLAGNGDTERWTAILGVEPFRQLVERVDLDFADTDKLWYGPAEAVKISLRLKNIDELVIRIFELNTLNCYRENPATIEPDLPLDGLIPNYERRIKRDRVPAVLVTESFDLPELDHRGVYIVDIVGGGKNCRALIRKGRLTATSSITASGNEITILDEQSNPVSPASLWVSGVRFDSGSDGKIMVPFSSSSGDTNEARKVILQHDAFTDLGDIRIVSEKWILRSLMHIDRESLIAGNKAEIILRPSLSVSGVPVPIENRLSDVVLTLKTTTLDGDEASREYRDLKLNEKGELLVDFPVPQRLRSIDLELSAKVRVKSQSRDQILKSSSSFAINRIDTTPEIVCPHLLRNNQDHVIELLGRNGEPRARLPVSLQLRSLWSNEEIRAELQTDGNGQILLGSLEGVAKLTVTVPGGTPRTWEPGSSSFQSTPSAITVEAGKEYRFPAPVIDYGDSTGSTGLYRFHDQSFQETLGSSVRVTGGWVTIQPLEPGDYLLKLGHNTLIRIWSVEGKPAGESIVNPAGEATVSIARSPAIAGIDSVADELQIRVEGATATTRVHVLASRYVPAFPAGFTLGGINDRAGYRQVYRWDSNRFISARNLGDEYLYILNRRLEKRFAGSMLERPTLLLAPWSLGPTENAREVLAMDEALNSAPDSMIDPSMQASGRDQQAGAAADDFANLDFLQSGSLVLANMPVPDEGIVRINPADLGDKHHLTIVVADLFSTTVRTHALAARALRTDDRRLREPLAVDEHVSLDKRVEVIRPGETFVISDTLTARFEAVTTLRDAWKILTASSDDSTAAEFEFLMRWNELNPAEKNRLYDEHACHEINFFLYRKDREFFDSVVRPLIINRHSKTFVDRYLLDADLSDWLTPWGFSQLNTFEKILLAERMAEQRSGIQQHLAGQFALLPPDELSIDRLFESAMAGRELEETVESKAKSLRPDARPAQRRERAANESESLGAKITELEDLKRSKDDDVSGKEGRIALIERDIRKSGAFRGGGGGMGGLGQISPEPANVELFFDKRGESPDAERSFYQAVRPTEKWVEYNYWKIRQAESTAARVEVNRFWKAYSTHDRETPFLSPDFVQCNRNLSEIILALSVLDLPIEAQEPEVEITDRRMEWTPQSPAIVFHQQLQPRPADPGVTRVMVSENFLDANDRYQMVDNRKVDKFVTGTFRTHQLYGAQVVVTNPGSTPQVVRLLVQIPEGAIAVRGSRETQTIQLDIPAFGASSHEYWFYFPTAGTFQHYPAHVSDNDAVLAWGNQRSFDVVDELDESRRDSWEYVSQNATDAELLEWISESSLHDVQLDRIAWRMKDRELFNAVTKILADRFVFDSTLWSYAVKHGDAKRMAEFLENNEQISRECGPVFRSRLLTLEPDFRRWYEHVEFAPLINARYHQVGTTRRILNDELWNQYSGLLSVLMMRNEFSSDDRMAIVYFMLAQERIEEALLWFSRIDRDSCSGKLQYDYVAAWLALVQANAKEAAEIANRYNSYPVPRWQKRFAAVAAIVDEAAGAQSGIIDPDQALEQQAKIAATLPSISLEPHPDGIVINYRNVESVQLNYHSMDVELLFSRDPFSSNTKGGMTLVRANFSETVNLDRETSRIIHSLPESFRRGNLIVEAVAGDQIASTMVYANNLDVQIAPSMGQLQVQSRDSGKLLPGVYVKAYARMQTGETLFLKDGYTDIRGRFDYVTQSTLPIEPITGISILISSEEHGSMIRQTDKPAQ